MAIHEGPRFTLIAAATLFYQRGWMMGTAGNLSARVPDGSFWITASGCSKGELTLDDFVHMNFNPKTGEATLGPIQPHPEHRPSAETSIHAAIYSLFPDAHACYHVHSVEANLVSRWTDGDALPLPPLEMLKGLGIPAETPDVQLPIFPNYADVPQIAQAIRDRLKQQHPQTPALLIRDHGVTVWASSPDEARNRLEIAEYIFRYMVIARQMGMQTQATDRFQ
jgi:methylthioribulose-1-phosphate dehydratase